LLRDGSKEDGQGIMGQIEDVEVIDGKKMYQ
jgi:hypothetical protein